MSRAAVSELSRLPPISRTGTPKGAKAATACRFVGQRACGAGKFMAERDILASGLKITRDALKGAICMPFSSGKNVPNNHFYGLFETEKRLFRARFGHCLPIAARDDCFLGTRFRNRKMWITLIWQPLTRNHKAKIADFAYSLAHLNRHRSPLASRLLLHC